MNKQALVKLATLKLAINHVLRQRMIKRAFWPFSSKIDYSKPGWEDNPRALKEVLKDLNKPGEYAYSWDKPKPGTVAGDAYLSLLKNRPDIAEAELFPKKRNSGMRGYGVPFRAYLENKLNLVKPDSVSFLENLRGITDEEWSKAEAEASKESLTPEELAILESYMKADGGYGVSQQQNILNSGLDGLSRLYWDQKYGKDYDPLWVETDWDNIEKAQSALRKIYRDKVKKLIGK